MSDILGWLSSWVGWVKRLLLALGLREAEASDVIVAIITAALIAVLASPKLLLRPLKVLWRKLTGTASPAPAAARYTPDFEKERDYLGWLAGKVQKIGHQWHDTPILPVPLAAVMRRVPWLVRRARWLAGTRLFRNSRFLRARLFRYDASDYARAPFLADLDLSLRAGFGRRLRIGDLAGELRKFSKIVVLGDPGSGKSVCLRQTAYDLAETGRARRSGPQAIPIVIDMGAYDTWEECDGARQPTPVLSFVKQFLRADRSLREAPSVHPLLYIVENLEHLLDQGRVTILFDALDEMPQESYQERYRALKDFMQHWERKGNRFIFSCRSMDYDQSFPVDEVIIEPFNRARIKMFLDRHVPSVAEALYERIIADESLFETVSNPFFLQALAFINIRSAGGASEPNVPSTRAKLIREFANGLLSREAGERQKEQLAGIAGGLDTLRSFLSELAFCLQTRRQGGTSARTADLHAVWDRYPDWRRLLWIASHARNLGKLGPEPEPGPDGQFAPPERIEFVHHRLQEFFAAEQLTRLLEQGCPVEEYLEDIWWQETVILATGGVENPASIVGKMLARRQDVERWLTRVTEIGRKADELAGSKAPEHKNVNKSQMETVAALQKQVEEWAGGLLDLPLVMCVLNAFRGVSEETTRILHSWTDVKAEAEHFARRRALFVAAEAAGQVSGGALARETELIRHNLGRLIEDGNSLQKVRALRGLRFVPSEDCLTHIDAALRGTSSWVKANAIQTLFRLPLKGRHARSVFLALLRRAFAHSLVGSMARELLSSVPRLSARVQAWEADSIFPLFRGLASGLWKERGGKTLAAVAVMLAGVAAVLNLTSEAIAMAVALAAASVALAVAAAGWIITFPIATRWVGRELSRREWVGVAVNAALDYALAAAILLLIPWQPACLVLIGFVVLSSLAMATHARYVAFREAFHGVSRIAVLVCIWSYAAEGASAERGTLVAAAIQGFWLAASIFDRRKTRTARSFLRSVLETIGVGVGSLAILGIFCVVMFAVIGPLVAVIIISIAGGAFGYWSLWLVQTIRVVVRASRQSHAGHFHSLFAYVQDVARDREQPVGARVRAVLALARFPVADPAVVTTLLDLADEDIPLKVKDAIYQVVDGIEKRIQRGQAGAGQHEPRIAEEPVNAGPIVRPYVALILAAAAVVQLVALFMTAGQAPMDFTENVARVGIGISAACCLFSVLFMGRRWRARQFAIMAACALTSIALTRELQAVAAWRNFGSASFFFRLDLGSVVSISTAVLFATLAVVAGLILYLLDTDTPISKAIGARQVLALVGLVLLFTAAQSAPLQEYLDLKAEPLPTLAGGNGAPLRLSNLTHDGRVIRVALMALDKSGANPSAAESFPKTGGVKKPNFIGFSTWRANRDVKKIMSYNADFLGEVWLSAENGSVEAWQAIPGGCISAAPAGDSEAIIRADQACLKGRSAKFVAIVYSLRRSPAVRQRARPEALAKEIRTAAATKRLLEYTLSPFSRVMPGPRP